VGDAARTLTRKVAAARNFWYTAWADKYRGAVSAIKRQLTLAIPDGTEKGVSAADGLRSAHPRLDETGEGRDEVESSQTRLTVRLSGSRVRPPTSSNAGSNFRAANACQLVGLSRNATNMPPLDEADRLILGWRNGLTAWPRGSRSQRNVMRARVFADTLR
jgi:hypothetical protein